MDPDQRFWLRRELDRIACRRRMEFMWDVASMFNPAESRDHIAEVARRAFAETEPDRYSAIILSLSQRRK